MAIYGTLLALDGPDWFSRLSKTMENYIKHNGLDDSYLETFKDMDESEKQKKEKSALFNQLLFFVYLF